MRNTTHFRNGVCSLAVSLTLLGMLPAYAAPPAAPSKLIAKTLSNAQVQLTWKDNSTDETVFNVDRRVSGQNWIAVATLAPNTTTYTCSGLSAGTLHWFRVRASKGSEYALSGDATAITSGGTAPVPAPEMRGVNLAGAEFGNVFPGTFGTHYTYPTNPAAWDYYHSKGMNLIRLPFRWERVQTTLNAPLVEAEMLRIDTCMSLARARGMKVILDMHNYDRRVIGGTKYLIGTTQVPNSAFRDVWKRIAARYAGETALYGYGLMNEPHDTGGGWVATAQQGVNGVRSSDSTHYIMVAGDGFSGAHRWDTANPNILSVVDPQDKIIYEAHVYFDNDASGFYDQNYTGEGATPTIGVDRVKVFTDWLTRNNHRRGFIGEYGVPGNVDSASWNIVLNNFLTHINSKGVSGTYWAGGPWWSGYALSVEPTNNFTTSKPQMAILQNHP